MIGSTMVTMLRIGVFLLFALANYVRSCNITILVEIASAKNGTTVAFFATRSFTLRQPGCHAGWTAAARFRHNAGK
jgi:hypothetical protein